MALQPVVEEMHAGMRAHCSQELISLLLVTITELLEFAKKYRDKSLMKLALKAIRCKTYADEITSL